MNMNKIDTIIFDIGNVLVDFCWEEGIAKMNLPDHIAERLANATIKSAMWNEYDRGILSDDELLEGFIANDTEIEDVIRLFILDYYKYIVRQRDYAHEWIKDLHAQGYKVYYLSNFSKRGHIEFMKELDFIPECDGGILSYEDKLIKPDAAIYELLIDRYNIVPENAVFIDDSEANVVAARKASLNAIRFTSREEVLKELKKYGV